MRAMRAAAAAAVAVALAVAALIAFWLGHALGIDAAVVDNSQGNPQGHRAGGRFSFVQYDDAMEILHDVKTGRDYLVWYWRDDVEVIGL